MGRADRYRADRPRSLLLGPEVQQRKSWCGCLDRCREKVKAGSPKAAELLSRFSPLSQKKGGEAAVNARFGTRARAGKGGNGRRLSILEDRRVTLGHKRGGRGRGFTSLVEEDDADADGGSGDDSEGEEQTTRRRKKRKKGMCGGWDPCAGPGPFGGQTFLCWRCPCTEDHGVIVPGAKFLASWDLVIVVLMVCTGADARPAGPACPPVLSCLPLCLSARPQPVCPAGL